MRGFFPVIVFLLTLSLPAQAQRSLSQISFYELESNDESAIRRDTSSWIVQIIPLVSKPNEPASLTERYVFEDKVGDNIIHLEYQTKKSDFANRKVDYDRQRIDGAVAYGHDGFTADKLTYIMQNYISEILLTINGKNVPIPARLHRNYFSCGIVRVAKALYDDLLFLHFSGGDGGGHYEIVWTVNSKGVVTPYINNGDVFFESEKGGSKKYFDILLHDDSWSYFEGHKFTDFKPSIFAGEDETAIALSRSLDLSITLESDPQYGDYGMVKSPARDEPIEFFISSAMKRKENPLEYEVAGLMRDGEHIVPLTGRQLIQQARLEKGDRGALIVHGTFVFNVHSQAYNKTLSGLWTVHIKELKATSTVDQGQINSPILENIFKSFSGTMTNTDGKRLELVKFGNATVAGNWFGTPSGNQWWRN